MKKVLSPHLKVYSVQITSMLSVLHRLSGVTLAIISIIITIGIIMVGCIGSNPEIMGLLEVITKILDWMLLGAVILTVWSLSYHITNGLRHMIWDTGKMLTNEKVNKTGKIALMVSTVLFALLMYLVIEG